MSRREKKKERKKEEILKSAASVFKQKGYHGTTMEDISEKLLMTKGSLYYYFEKKEDLLYACQDYSLDRLQEALEKVRKSKDSPEQKLRALIVHHVKLISDELSASVMHIEFDALAPALLKKVIEKRDRYERGFRQIVQEGIKEGVFVPCDPKIVSFAILGAINWMTKWFSSKGEFGFEKIANDFADYFIRGLRAPTQIQPERSYEAPVIKQPNADQFLSYD